VLDGIFSFVYVTEKKTGSISIKSPNILFRAVFVIDCLGIQRLHLHGEVSCLFVLMFNIYISSFLGWGGSEYKL